MAEEDQTQNDNQEGQEPDNQTASPSAEDDKTVSEGSQEESSQQNMVPYDRFQQVIEEKNKYKNELEQLKDKLEEMDDPEEVKEEYETKLEKMEKSAVNSAKEFALKKAALQEGVNKSALDDFAKVADLSEIEAKNVDDVEEVENLKFEGVEDLIETMKEEKEYFFAGEEEETVSSAGDQYSESGENQESDESLREAMGLG